MNGPVDLTMPSDAKASIEATTVHGGIDNDFGLHTNNHRFVGHDMRGELGGGGAEIRLSNVNGPSTSITQRMDTRSVRRATRATATRSDKHLDRRRLRNGCKRRGKRVHGPVDLFPRNDERRLEAHHVSVNAADTDQHSLSQQSVANGFGFGVGGRELFVAHQLDTNHQAEAANFSDQRVLLLQLSQLLHCIFAGFGGTRG